MKSFICEELIIIEAGDEWVPRVRSSLYSYLYFDPFLIFYNKKLRNNEVKSFLCLQSSDGIHIFTNKSQSSYRMASIGLYTIWSLLLLWFQLSTNVPFTLPQTPCLFVAPRMFRHISALKLSCLLLTLHDFLPNIPI